MKKKLTAAGVGLAAVGLLAIGAPNSHAACGAGTSYDPASGATYTTQGLPDGGTVYAHGNGGQTDVAAGGYAGVTGDHGYLEAGGTPGDPSTASVSGQSTDAPLSGSLSSSGICVNDTTAP